MCGRGMLGSLHSNEGGMTIGGECGVLDGSRETFIPLGIAVLQSNSDLESLDEVPLLLLGILEDFLDGASHA